MIITQIESMVVAVPLVHPVSISTRLLRARDYVLVKVHTDEGVTGVGYIYAGVTGGRVVHAGVTDMLAPLLIGKDPLAIEAHWASMYQEVLLLGRRGALIRSISCIDIALWDLMGKVTGQPLYRLLGGYRDTVPAYASGGYYQPGKGIEGLARELNTYREMGFQDYKIKVGGVSLAEDVERVRIARETIGPQARLALDANNAWKTPFEAIKSARAFDPYDIWWLEEPLAPDDVEGHAQISAALDTPVATGEIEAGRWGFADLITRRAADILQPDAGVMGGVSEWMKVAHAAAAFNIPVAPHWHANLHVHLAGAAPNCMTVEYFVLEEDIYNFEALLVERLRPENGQIRIPDRPGLGLILDEDAIGHYRVA